MPKSLWTVSVLVVSVAAAPACASKKFVRTEVGNVDTKAETLGTSLEETQARTDHNEARIAEVDAKAEAAGRSATGAHATADTASTIAQQAKSRAHAVGSRVDEVSTTLAASRRLVAEVTLTEDQGRFEFGDTQVPDEGKSRLDQIVTQLKSEPTGAFIEIEGHTDSIGDVTYNERLGLERAEAVKRYLHEQHQVPLHRINVISFGETKPVAENNTREGRAQNRRVVIRVVS